MYGSLQLIITPPELLHTIAIYFIVSLPFLVTNEFNSIFIVTNNLSNKIGLITKCDTYTAEKWASKLFKHFAIMDRGLSKAIISDRNPKFMSTLWTEMCKDAGTSLLTTTACNSQEDR